MTSPPTHHRSPRSLAALIGLASLVVIAVLAMTATFGSSLARADSSDAQVAIQVSNSMPNVGSTINYSYNISWKSVPEDYTFQVLQQQSDGSYAAYTPMTTTSLAGDPAPGSTTGSGNFTVPDTSRYEFVVYYYAQGQSSYEDEASIVVRPQATYQLCGTVVRDTNQNGLADPGETGYANVGLQLSTGATTTTASNGTYCFTGLVNGSYSVTRTTTPAGTEATTDADGSANGTNYIGGHPATSSPGTSLAVINNANSMANDFGLLNYQLCGTVVIDTNMNGLADPGETPVAGVALALSTGATTTSASNGTYCFTGLTNGTYTVTETVPSGYTATDDASGPNDGRNIITGATIDNANLPKQDFGIIQTPVTTTPPPTTTTTPPPTTTTIVTPPPTTTTIVTPPPTITVTATAPVTTIPVTPPVAPKPVGTEKAPVKQPVKKAPVKKAPVKKVHKPVTPKPVGQVKPTRAKLSITKQAAHPVYKPGSVSTWTIKVKDVSKVTAKNVTMCDLLPSGTQFVSASRSVNFTGAKACFKLGNIRAGKTVTTTVKLTIDQNTTKTHITNPAEAQAKNAGEVHAHATIRIPKTPTPRSPAPVTG